MVGNELSLGPSLWKIVAGSGVRRASGRYHSPTPRLCDDDLRSKSLLGMIYAWCMCTNPLGVFENESAACGHPSVGC